MSDEAEHETPAADDERRRRAEQRVGAKIALAGHAVIYVAVNISFLVLVGADWLWVTLFWGLGLLAQAWAVFTDTSRTLRDWKEREIQRELARDDKGD